jgi:hypothetical protein
MTETIDLLADAICQCESEIAALRAREQRHRTRAEAVAIGSIEKAQAGASRTYMQQAIEKRLKVEKRLAQLRRQQAAEGNDTMRRGIEDVAPTTLAPPTVEHILVCRKSGGLKVGETQFRYGQQMDPSVLTGTLNGNYLFVHGHVKWELKTTYKPPVEAKADAPPVTMKPTDHVVTLAFAMQKLVDEGKARTLIEAEDVVDRDLFDAGQKQFTHEPGTAKDGAFGGGGGREVKTGAGTLRRIFDIDRFRQRIRDILKKKEAA